MGMTTESMIPYVFPRVIALTSGWIAVDKPSGWLTIPGRGQRSSSAPSKAPVLAEWLEKELGARIWVVHRIDRETSGLVLFARSAEAHREASLWFQRHQVKKQYDLLAEGVPGAPILRIGKPIGGASSITQIERRESYGACFLARATPVTGRRHQIRIHLAGRGHALLGDVEYQGRKELVVGDRTLLIGRVALHAARLELPGGESFEAPWPGDFQGWVDFLRAGAIREGSRN